MRVLGRLQLRRPGDELLPEGQRHRVHQVGAAGLDHLGQRLAAPVDGLAQVLQRRQQLLARTASCADTRIAVGITSLELCPRLTWSLGCTARLAADATASVAMTSLAFMLRDVPEPVWNTSIGKCASYSPSATRSARLRIAVGHALRAAGPGRR